MQTVLRKSFKKIRQNLNVVARGSHHCFSTSGHGIDQIVDGFSGNVPPFDDNDLFEFSNIHKSKYVAPY